MSKTKPVTAHPAATSQRAKLWQFLVLAGVVVAVIAIVLLKQEPAAAPPTVQAANELPEAQLMRALDTGTPTLAFFHSLTCDSCKEMTAIVAEVYPEFAGSIALVDVDVYDDRNAGLLRAAGIRAIPTVVFFDRSGEGKVHIGVVGAEDLRQILTAMQKGG